jgi:hypothetical protein
MKPSGHHVDVDHIVVFCFFFTCLLLWWRFFFLFFLYFLTVFVFVFLVRRRWWLEALSPHGPPVGRGPRRYLRRSQERLV